MAHSHQTLPMGLRRPVGRSLEDCLVMDHHQAMGQLLGIPALGHQVRRCVMALLQAMALLHLGHLALCPSGHRCHPVDSALGATWVGSSPSTRGTGSASSTVPTPTLASGVMYSSTRPSWATSRSARRLPSIASPTRMACHRLGTYSTLTATRRGRRRRTSWPSGTRTRAWARGDPTSMAVAARAAASDAGTAVT